MDQPVWQPLTIIALDDAIVIYQLDARTVDYIQAVLAGKERRLADGRIGYRVPDLVEVLTVRRAA